MPEMASIFVLTRKGALELFFKTAVHWKRKNPKLTTFSFPNVLINYVFHYFYYYYYYYYCMDDLQPK